MGIPDVKHKGGSGNSALNTFLPSGVPGPSVCRTTDEWVVNSAIKLHELTRAAEPYEMQRLAMRAK